MSILSYARLKLLIVEDDVDYAFLIKDYLKERFGHLQLELNHATNFHDALQEIDKNGTYDLFIFDYLLNHINGIDLITAVRSRGIDSPIIFLTGYGNEDIVVSAFKAGATDYISKAKLTPEILMRAVHHVLEAVAYERQKKRDSEALRLKTRELEELTHYLEQRVAEEVNKSRQKDHMVMMQNRLAAMGEMLGYVAHQWKQPLNALGLIVQDLQEACLEGEADRDFYLDAFHRLMEIIKHMATTVDDFRRFLSPDKQKRPCLLSDVVNKTINLVKDSFKDRFIKIDLRIIKDSELLCLPNELCHVLLNILNNARDALIERKVSEPQVTITIDKTDGRPLISISDNAGGIEESLLPSIFEPYVTTKQDGSGIGLYLSRLIVEKNMGGRIYARNIENGAEFVVLF